MIIINMGLRIVFDKESIRLGIFLSFSLVISCPVRVHSLFYKSMVLPSV